MEDSTAEKLLIFATLMLIIFFLAFVFVAAEKASWQNSFEREVCQKQCPGRYRSEIFVARAVCLCYSQPPGDVRP